MISACLWIMVFGLLFNTTNLWLNTYHLDSVAQNLPLINGHFPTLSNHLFAMYMISFTKMKFRQLFWGAEQVYIFIGSKVMTQNANISLSVFFNFVKKLVICVMFFPFFCIFCVFAFFCISLITFEPIKIQTCSASQNDRLNFSFVKDTHVVGEKMTRSGRKTDI